MLKRQQTLGRPGEFCFSIGLPIAGPIDLDRFAHAWQALHDDTPILRGAIVTLDTGRGVKVITGPRRVEVDVVRVGEDSFADAREAFEIADKGRGLDYTRGEVARATLRIRDTGDAEWHFVFSVLSMDLASFLGLFQNLHAEVVGGTPPLVLESPAKFYEWLGSHRADDDRYWNQRLAAIPWSPRLVAQRHPVADTPLVYRDHQVVLPAAVATRARRAAASVGVSLNVLCQGAWVDFLARQTGADTVVYGVTVEGRPPQLVAADRMLGRFLNILPIVSDAPLTGQHIAMLRALQSTLAQALEHPRLSTDLAAERLSRPGQLLFDTNFVYEHTSFDRAATERYRLVEAPHFSGPPETPLKVELSPDVDGEFRVMLSCLPQVADDAQVRGWIDAYVRSIEAMVDGVIAESGGES